MTPRVVIVGAGLTGLATAFRLHRAGARVTVVDAAPRAGGLLRSERRDGYLVEWASHGFLDDADATLALARDAGLPDEAVVRAAPASAERHLVHNGSLVRAPGKPQEIITTPLLPLKGKLRLLREPRVPPLAAGAPEESVAQFARRRFGDEAAHLADAFVTGVHAGDPERLSLPHAFPQLAAMEREHGSILRALRVRGRSSARRARLATFRDGMEALPRALAAALPPGALRLGEPAARVARKGGGLVVETARATLEADRVLVALPPAAAARVVDGASIPETRAAPVAVVALGYARERADGATGFGYLAPEREGRFALGALYESNLFPGRAPDGHVLVRALVGGARHPERAALSDDELVARVREDLAGLHVATGEPAFATVARAGAIPQLDVGQAAVLAEAARLEAALPGLAFGGAGWRGVAVNALVAEAEALARRALA